MRHGWEIPPSEQTPTRILELLRDYFKLRLGHTITATKINSSVSILSEKDGSFN